MGVLQCNLRGGKGIHTFFCFKIQQIISILYWNTSVCSIKTPNCEHIFEDRYVLSPPWVAFCTALHEAQVWTDFPTDTNLCILFFFLWFLFWIFFYFFLSRLKQVSLSLWVRNEVYNISFCLTGALHFLSKFNKKKTQQSSVVGRHTTTWYMTDPQERSCHETKALKLSQWK